MKGVITVPTEVTATIGDIVRRHAREAPASLAFISEGQEPLTYRELASVMDRLQSRLNALGFGRGDRIAAVGRSDAVNAALVTGIWGCAAAVPLNPDLSADEFASYLRELKVKAVAVDARMDTRARAAAREAGLPVLEVETVDPRVAGMIDIRPGNSAGSAASPGPAQLDDLGVVMLTSGTTSRSKVVPVPHRHLSIKAHRFAKGLELTTSDRCLNLMPLFHVHGLYCALGGTLVAGGSLVTLPEFSEEAFFRQLVSLAPTWYTGAYTFHHAIRAAAPNHVEEIGKSRLRFIRSASGILDPRIADEIETFFHVPVTTNYSSTETSVICSGGLTPATRKRGTLGRAFDSEVAIMGDDRRLLPPGERGEVVVKDVQDFAGYENDPAANAQCFIDGWFRTGDEGVLDADGYLTITGRVKDIINRGGEKITPSEVDDALIRHPDISAAVTFPIPHATLGQEVAAAVVPVKGAVLSDEMVANYLRGRLAPFKVPRRILIVDEIPKGATAKLARRNMAEAFGLDTDASLPRLAPAADERPPTPLEAKLQRLWADVLRLDRVGLDEDFFMLGGDSLQAVELFLRIEKEIGRRLPRSTLFRDGTVAKMAARIEEGVPSSCLVPIQPKGDRPPFFCVHDGNGQVLNYRDLARLVGKTQPFYGIQSRGLDGEEEPFTNIDDMAACYIGEIKKVQPEGPYYLGGYSFGGRVAYVMAQQLRDAGEDVAFLGLFDVYSQAGRARVAFGDWLLHHWKRLKAMPPRALPGYFALRVSNLFKTIYMKLRLKSYAAAWQLFKSRGKPLPRFLYLPVPANDMIRRGYRARPYDGDATLFKAELYAWAHADQHEGWHKLIKGKLDIRRISGRHYEIVKPPHVQTLARELSDALQKAQAARATAERLSLKVS